jgi:hypothetical protein
MFQGGKELGKNEIMRQEQLELKMLRKKIIRFSREDNCTTWASSLSPKFCFNCSQGEISPIKLKKN